MPNIDCDHEPYIIEGMDNIDLSPLRKTRAINLDPSFYGTFAEIGAGQEVARYFFMAGRASQTVAKTISAYDMTVSDSIYGRTGRYVCEERVLRMLDHEYKLLDERLMQQRGANTRFFVLADTVATSNHAEPSARCHGWMGVRFQMFPKGPTNDIILHVRMRDKSRLQQQEALGILGVNLVSLAHNLPNSLPNIINELGQNLTQERIEINLLRFVGPDVKHIDNRLLNLEMVKSGFTEAILFKENGDIVNPSDELFKKAMLVQRGTFRPVTNTNVALLERGLKQFKATLAKEQKYEVCFELTMNSLSSQGQLDETDFLHRVDTLCSLGHKVMLTNFNLFYQVKSFLRAYTDQPIAMIVGAGHLEKLFNSSYYTALPGGMLEGFSRLFDDKTKLLVFPDKSETTCLTASTFSPEGTNQHLYRYLLDKHQVLDIGNCDDVDTTIHSQDVRRMLANNDPQWEKLVPPSVQKLIKKFGMFGASSS